MRSINSVCVYCGSAPGRNPLYATVADELGRTLAGAGVRLVYGGGSVGLMGRIARSVLAHGGAVTGIIPQFLADREVMLKDADDLVVTADMHERKRLMFEKSDAFVAMPGGIGTLEEVVEMMTWAQLGQHDKPIALLDVGGFWRPLVDLLDHMRAEAFIRPGYELRYEGSGRRRRPAAAPRGGARRCGRTARGRGGAPADVRGGRVIRAEFAAAPPPTGYAGHLPREGGGFASSFGQGHRPGSLPQPSPLAGEGREGGAPRVRRRWRRPSPATIVRRAARQLTGRRTRRLRPTCAAPPPRRSPSQRLP